MEDKPGEYAWDGTRKGEKRRDTLDGRDQSLVDIPTFPFAVQPVIIEDVQVYSEHDEEEWGYNNEAQKGYWSISKRDFDRAVFREE
jgi:hypothetical protein